MRPAWSVILLTTLIGAGQGLFLALFARTSARRCGQAARPVRAAPWRSLLLVGAGCVASFFHLGRPERAWRSAAHVAHLVAVARGDRAARCSWRSSRPYGACTGWAGADRARGRRARRAACVALFVCTGDDLRLPAVPAGMAHAADASSTSSLLGRASGLTLAARARRAALHPALARALRARRARRRARSPTLIAARRRSRATRACGRSRRSPPPSASSIRASCRSRRAPWAARSTRASSSTAGRARSCARRAGRFLALVFPAAGAAARCGRRARPRLLARHSSLQFAGLLAERWYFFAEAKHPQNLYYQAIA